ncbi:MAG: hypothetical protein ChlgKO_02740 [Chlamydiales bacterium]
MQKSNIFSSNECSPEKYSFEDVELFSIYSIVQTPYFKGGAITPCLSQFCYTVVKRTLQALCDNKYTCFDAHTTANCCHGMAVLVKSLISDCRKFDIKLMLKEIEACEEKFNDFLLPEQILSLSSLYILTYSVETKPGVGRRTKPKKLKELSEIGTNLCNQIVRGLQKKYSNLVCDNYLNIYNDIPLSVSTCGVSIEKWARYSKGNFLKTDKHGIKYASCTYSMQVVLAHLITSFAKIAVINDVLHENKRVKRNVYILQGDGERNFNLLSESAVRNIGKESKTDPVIVFGGCSIKKEETDEFSANIEQWLLNFPALVLSCDIFYPEFPSVRDDVLFDSSPIDQKDREILLVFNRYSKTLGVFADNPTLFCLTHIHTASLHQIISELQENALPKLSNYFIPHAITARQSEKSMQLANC